MNMKDAMAVFALCTITCDANDGRIDIGRNGVGYIEFNGSYYELRVDGEEAMPLEDIMFERPELAQKVLDAYCILRDEDPAFDQFVKDALEAARNAA